MSAGISGSNVPGSTPGRRARRTITAARPIYLVSLDPKAESSPAVDRAAWFATRTQARLSLFMSESMLAIDREPGLRDKLLDRDRERLQREADRLVRRGLQTDVDVRWGPENDSVIRKAGDSAAAIVFRDTHYHSALRRALFSNIEWSLIRHCPAPLWLVKDRPFAGSPRVLAAVDPSGEHGKSPALDEEILAAANNVSQATAGELYVVHVVGPVQARASAVAAAAGAPPAAGAVVADPFPHDRAEDRTLAALDRLVANAGIDRRCLKIERGVPSNLLVEVARDVEADLVVMGAVSRNPIRNALIGNTAERVLDRLPCDLLVVKEPATAG
jgi:universal stress protein E